MALGTPNVACIGLIGKHNNPLHISLFPPDQRDPLEFQFLLSSAIDIFEERLPHKTADPDFGLLRQVDTRLAMHGWFTNTGVKYVIVVDMAGKPATLEESRRSPAAVHGLRDTDLKPAFRALQAAYVRLLRNPFYDPDEHSPRPRSSSGEQSGLGSMQISSPMFLNEVERIGRNWQPGMRVV